MPVGIGAGPSTAFDVPARGLFQGGLTQPAAEIAELGFGAGPDPTMRIDSASPTSFPERHPLAVRSISWMVSGSGRNCVSHSWFQQYSHASPDRYGLPTAAMRSSGTQRMV